MQYKVLYFNIYLTFNKYPILYKFVVLCGLKAYLCQTLLLKN